MGLTLVFVVFAGIIGLQVNGLNTGSGSNEFLGGFRFGNIKKRIATIAVSTGILGSVVPYPMQYSVAYADETVKVAPEKKKGLITIDGEAARIFRKALQCESDGDLIEAQNFFQQVVEVEPDYIYAWSNLGNVLTSRGNLNEALLCYKKAISLYPPREALSAIVLNKASIEMAIGQTDAAIKDLDAAERLAGPQPSILTTKAVALTNDGRWSDASTIFEKVISTADRNALPWWLRYSMALLETDRGIPFIPISIPFLSPALCVIQQHSVHDSFHTEISITAFLPPYIRSSIFTMF